MKKDILNLITVNYEPNHELVNATFFIKSNVSMSCENKNFPQFSLSNGHQYSSV